MSKMRAYLFASLAAVALAASSPVQADTVAAPFVPPAPVDPDVPPQVTAAIIVLREACAAWHPPATGAVSNPAQPVAPAQAQMRSEGTVCAVAVDPMRAYLQTMVFAGVAGAILFFVGLLVFSLLRGLLISAWNWRPRLGAQA
jgi:hypothetical protein